MGIISSLNKSIKDLPPEIQVVICCSRLKFSHNAKNKVEKLLQDKIVWEFLFQTADQHRVLPIVYKNLTENFTEVIPQTFFEDLRFWYHNNAIHNKLLLRELSNLADKFKELDIPAIFFKGPIAALSIYENIGLRQFNDLDVLVEEEDYFRAQKHLVKMGYQKVTDWEYESGYRHKESGINVDLHRRFDNYRLYSNYNFVQLYGRLETMEVQNTTLPCLTVEDTLINLCINFSKDLFINKTKLSQLSDMVNLIDKHQEINWAGIVKRASKLGVKRILFLCLSLTHQIFGLNTSTELFHQINAQRGLKSLQTKALGRMINLLSGKCQFLEYKGGYIANKMLYLQMKECPADRLPIYYQITKYYIRYLTKKLRDAFIKLVLPVVYRRI
jgi:hypothetical protein